MATVAELLVKMVMDNKQFITGSNQADASLNKLRNSAGQFSKAIEGNHTVMQQFGKTSVRTTYTIDKLGNATVKSVNSMQDLRQGFDMALLSFMFFGMMLQRTFDTIMRSSLDVYKKMTDGSTEAAKGVSRLAIHWQFLQFSVGEAIAQFITANPWILDIIDSISEWVQNNGMLVAGLVFLGFILGTVLMLIGQLGLFYGALAMKSAAAGIAAQGVGTATAAGATVSIGALALIAAAIIALTVIAIDNWDEITAVWKDGSEFISALWHGNVESMQNESTDLLTSIKNLALGIIGTILKVVMGALYIVGGFINNIFAMFGIGKGVDIGSVIDESNRSIDAAVVEWQSGLSGLNTQATESGDMMCKIGDNMTYALETATQKGIDPASQSLDVFSSLLNDVNNLSSDQSIVINQELNPAHQAEIDLIYNKVDAYNALADAKSRANEEAISSYSDVMGVSSQVNPNS